MSDAVARAKATQHALEKTKQVLAPKPDLPMPGDRIFGAIVVASVWMNDDLPDITALVLLLRPEPQFYVVADIYRGWKGWAISYETEHPNIVPAVDEYQVRGGDY